MERIRNITGIYRQRIFEQEGGDYWEPLFCWPSHIIEEKGIVGVVMPAYRKCFFLSTARKTVISSASRVGKRREMVCLSEPSAETPDPRERGSWMSYLTACIKISRSVRRLHMAGLAHSDLSYKNVLLDPAGGNSCIIDIDTLVVPGKYPPDVVGTPDFIAPEVMKTLKLPIGDAGKFLPRIETDRHALAVLECICIFSTATR